MKLSFQKKVLLSMGVVAGIGALAGAGTFATFTAQTTNPTNTFADGTLVLSNKVGTGTACLSTGGLTTDVNANGSCDTAFSLSVKAPGDSSTANLTLQNKGAWPPRCSRSSPPPAPTLTRRARTTTAPVHRAAWSSSTSSSIPIPPLARRPPACTGVQPA